MTNIRNITLPFSFFLVSTAVLAQSKQDTAIKTDVPHFDLPITRQVNTAIGEGGNTFLFDMAPETTPRVVAAAVKAIPTKMAPGPFKPTWESLQANYKVPKWFIAAKFGLFMQSGAQAGLEVRSIKPRYRKLPVHQPTRRYAVEDESRKSGSVRSKMDGLL